MNKILMSLGAMAFLLSALALGGAVGQGTAMAKPGTSLLSPSALARLGGAASH